MRDSLQDVRHVRRRAQLPSERVEHSVRAQRHVAARKSERKQPPSLPDGEDPVPCGLFHPFALFDVFEFQPARKVVRFRRERKDVIRRRYPAGEIGVARHFVRRGSSPIGTDCGIEARERFFRGQRGVYSRILRFRSHADGSGRREKQQSVRIESAGIVHGNLRAAHDAREVAQNVYV